MRSLLNVIGATERWLTISAFALMALALLADVISRRIFLTGLIGATEIAVVGMVAVAMFGIGVATDTGAHLRPRLFDFLIPKSFEPVLDRLVSAVTAAFFAVFAGLAVWMVIESVILSDRTEILRLPIWTLQMMIAAAFITNFIRFAAYAIDPGLKPGEFLEEIREAAADAGDLADGEPR